MQISDKVSMKDLLNKITQYLAKIWAKVFVPVPRSVDHVVAYIDYQK